MWFGWLLAGCQGLDGEQTGLRATLTPYSSEAPAARVAIEGADSDSVVVEVQNGEEPVLTVATSAAPGGGLEAYVAGVMPGAELRWRAVSPTEATEWETWQTEEARLGLPVLTSKDPVPLEHGLFLATSPSTGPYALVFDTLGRLVWWGQPDIGVQLTQSRLSRDGRFVVLLETEEVSENEFEARLHGLPLFGDEEWFLVVPYAHHDFLEMDDGSFVVIATDARTHEGEEYWGDALVRAERSGTLTPIWSVWDYAEPGDDVVQLPQEGGGTVWEWTHANGLAYESEANHFLVSMHNLNRVDVVDAATGLHLGSLGGPTDAFALEEGTPYSGQHGPAAFEGGFILFDNGLEHGVESRAVEYTYDLEAGTYRQGWSFVSDPSTYAPYFGSAARLSNGERLVNWGAAGRISRVSESGEVLGQIDAEIGTVFSFVHPLDRLGP